MTATPFQYYRDLVTVLVTKELKLRYKFTVLGYAWSVLHPLVFALVYFILLKKVLRVPAVDLLMLITAMFPWQWFQNSSTASCNFFLGNWMLLKKVRFPRSALVLAGVLNDLVHFVASIPVIIAFMLYFGAWPSWAWLWQIPFLVAVQLGFTFGLSLVVATTNLFFRDLERLVGILTMLWFFATPVLYAADQLRAAGMAWLLYVNPMAPVTECWRCAFLTGALPADLAAVAAAYALAAAGAGWLVYRRHEWRFAEVV
jgi:lipopolysaccharide transport system permease protein